MDSHMETKPCRHRRGALAQHGCHGNSDTEPFRPAKTMLRAQDGIYMLDVWVDQEKNSVLNMLNNGNWGKLCSECMVGVIRKVNSDKCADSQADFAREGQ